MKKGLWLLLIIPVLILIMGVAYGAYYLGTQSTRITTVQTAQNNKPITSVSLTPSGTIQEQPLFTGTMKKISTDLNLFKLSDADKQNGVQDSILYYEAGTFTRGAFAGYTRILAVRPSEGPGPSMKFLLATKDYKSYVLDDPDNKTVNYPADDWDNPFMYFDTTKIAKAVTLDTDHTKSISLQAPFTLIREDSVLTEFQKNDKAYVESALIAFNKSALLSSPEKQLTLYAGGTEWGTGEGYSASEKAALETRKKYLHASTLVQGADSTGLTYLYVLSTKKDVDAYTAQSVVAEQMMIEYKKQVALYNEKKLKDYPPSPDFATFPGLRFTSASVGIVNGYKTYDAAFPGACGGNQSTFVVDPLSETDLIPVSSTFDVPLFTLKDANHPLNRLGYSIKTAQGADSFKAVNDGKSMPSFAEFVTKNPLLFFKDSWGRWVVVGEFDLKLIGGCGKPVVYLYPEKPTQIHLSFGTRVALTTQIPSYHDGWNVEATPTGVLTDLQAQYTDCSTLSSAFGSEYAWEACKKNSYPYIYWSGKSRDTVYPSGNDGWVVERANLSSFMQDKLQEIGLTEKESNDMISYWGPKMSEQALPYYHIRFIQTKEMNAFIPMNVNPVPDSVLRVFLDWKGLRSKPATLPVPQQLEKPVRNGFTYVEWGGLQ